MLQFSESPGESLPDALNAHPVQPAQPTKSPAGLKDTQSRKYLLTINNPRSKGITQETIREIIEEYFSTCIYYCLADEIGGKENTHHTHIFLMFSSAVRFSQIKKHFPAAHIDRCKGTAQENRDYVFKEGKHLETDKATTNLRETRFEWGDLPQEPGRGSRTDLAALHERIRSGISTLEIIEEFPEQILNMSRIELARQRIQFSENKSQLRELFVAYIHGRTGTGKTRSIYEIHSPETLYRITDYKNPFDNYEGEEILVLDEFRSSLNIEQILNILDIYPVTLPARYTNKQAAYCRVYIISNLNLEAQYPAYRFNDSKTWDAFKRRIHCLIDFDEIAAAHNDFSNRLRDLEERLEACKILTVVANE